jgi:two-component system, chemotaxis family, sensor histidine kinase and response regulator WspE
MSPNNVENLDSLSMADLFRMEVETQSAVLSESLLALERDAGATHRLQDMMRAAHSLKGAARIVGRNAAVQVAHSMEDCIVAVQNHNLILSDGQVDAMLAGVDLLGRIAQVPDEALEGWDIAHQEQIDAFIASLSLQAVVVDLDPTAIPQSAQSTSAPHAGIAAPNPPPARAETTDQTPVQTEFATKSSTASERTIRVTADNLNRLLGLAGEARVRSGWLYRFTREMLRLKQHQQQLARNLDGLRDSLAEVALSTRTAGRLNEFHDRMTIFQRLIVERLEEVERFDRDFSILSSRLYDEVLDCRMRPFADGIQMFPRMVRDLAHSLGKSASLEIIGEVTTVDRDILERLKAPLDHLLRNAIDHGIELPAERQQAGKPIEAVLKLTARHHAGMLLITLADDGRGIELEGIRRVVIERKLTTSDLAQAMSEAELFQFLFLPGFTLKKSVSEISGRGVGLDVVQAMVKDVGGTVRVSSQAAQGTRFQLELPLTLSVIRTLVLAIGGEPYAIPLARVDTALKLPREKVQSLEGRQHFTVGEQQIGLVAANQVLELESSPSGEDLSIIVLGDKTASYGLVVDRFLGEQELVVRPLDARLGKVRNVSAAGLMPDGSPLLIIDVDDLIRNIENIVSGERLTLIGKSASGEVKRVRKHVLVVDDSLTVRELERKLLDSRGYAVDVAVDGMDGWNAVRTGHYDLVITDVDMPRLDGIELVTLIRKDGRLKSLPVMIVSYKDRQEDRLRGLEAGADHYLTKGSFHDESLIAAVGDLIGRAES